MRLQVDKQNSSTPVANHVTNLITQKQDLTTKRRPGVDTERLHHHSHSTIHGY